MAEDEQQGSRAKRPMIEWIAGAVGLVLTLALLGFVGWQAFRGPENAAPQIAVHIAGISQAGNGYVVEMRAENRVSQTAAGVEVQGTLTHGDGTTETSSTTFDYLPGYSEARGGLFFTSDPREAELQVRALGYRRP